MGHNAEFNNLIPMKFYELSNLRVPSYIEISQKQKKKKKPKYYKSCSELFKYLAINFIR